MSKLNLASGPSVFPGWINIDKVDMREYIQFLRTEPRFGMPPEQRALAEKVVSMGVTFVQHDLRKGIPSDADTASHIYAGQFIEHLNPVVEVPRFLRECHRVLRPGGIARISTPDFELILDAFLKKKMGDFAHEQPSQYTAARSDWTRIAYLLFGSLGPDSNSEHYEGHQMAYSPESITEVLEETGFKDIRIFRAGDSQDPVFQKECVDTGRSHSLYAEVRK